MPINNIFRFISGNITVSLCGTHTEKFINCCIKESISIWNINHKDNILYFSTSPLFYKKLRHISKKSNCKMKIIHKNGLPFFIRKNRDKAGLFLGIIPFIGVIYFLSLFVWNIDIIGIDSVNEYDILNQLKETGIYEGALMNNIDAQSSKRQAFYKISELSWVSVNKVGSNIVVELTERDSPPDLTDKNTVTNIKASYDGQIVAMNIKKGVKEAKIGDAVIKGQLLATGIIESTAGTVRLERAEGEVFAKTKHTLTSSVLLENKIYLPTENCIYQKEVSIFNLKLPVTIKKNIDETYNLKTSTKYLIINENTLPIYIKEDKWQEYSETNINFSKTQAEKIANEKLSLIEAFAYNDIQISEKTTQKTETNVGITVTANYVCIEDIAVIEEIKIENSTSKEKN